MFTIGLACRGPLDLLSVYAESEVSAQAGGATCCASAEHASPGRALGGSRVVEVLALVMAAMLVFTVYTELSPTEQATARQGKAEAEGSGSRRPF